MTILESLRKALRGEAVEGLSFKFPPPVAQLIGFDCVHVEEGKAVFRLEARRDKHANPMGTLHGGILCDMADGAMGIACATLLEPGESFTTIEIKMNFFRPVTDGLIEARARVVHAGKTVVYGECDLVALPQEKLIAKSTCTNMILRGDQARGR